MPNFKGNKRIVLQPRDSNVVYRFDFTNCTSTASNDGFLPFGTNIIATSYLTFNRSGDEVTDIIDSIEVSNNNILATMSYPTTSPTGTYKLTLILTLDDGSELEADFRRIVVKDL